jgi:predicted negative regulator of RcsB-dependent stress response
MAQALSDANLALHGTRYSPPAAPGKSGLPLAAEDATFPAAIRLRLAALLLDQNKYADAAAAFAEVTAALAAFPAVDSKRPPADALLPNPEPREATVPLAESIGFLQIRAAAGAAYARWAAAQRAPQDADLAAKTYRRMLVSYAMTTESLDALKAIADLGLAELYVQSGQFPQASAALASTPAVPQDFWQEMRRTEAAVRSGRGTP